MQSDDGTAHAGERSGFTLIELLVVISIIILLTTIIVPNTARAREKARRAKCMNNLRGIAACLTMYAEDNGSRYPETLGELYNENYCPDLETFNCPSTPRRITGTLGTGLGKAGGGTITGSDYGYDGGRGDSFGGQNALVADKPASGTAEGRPNHPDPKGNEEGRNVMFASGTVRWVALSRIDSDAEPIPNLSNVN